MSFRGNPGRSSLSEVGLRIAQGLHLAALVPLHVDADTRGTEHSPSTGFGVDRDQHRHPSVAEEIAPLRRHPVAQRDACVDEPEA